MLASILPGLREARVPLAAGLLWLTALAIAFSWVLPLIPPTLLQNQIAPLAGWLGTAVWLAVVAFVAYLVGLCVLSLPPLRDSGAERLGLSATSEKGLDQKISRELREARRRKVPFSALVAQFDELALQEATRMSDEEREELVYEMRAEYPVSGLSLEEIAEADRWAWIEHPDQVAKIRGFVAAELSLAELSLQASNSDIYDKYDRARAEGEFRRAVSVPLAAIAIAFAARLAMEYASWVPLLALVGIAPAVLLWFSGRSQLMSARDTMVQAVLGGQASSPTLKLITDLQPPNIQASVNA